MPDELDDLGDDGDMTYMERGEFAFALTELGQWSGAISAIMRDGDVRVDSVLAALHAVRLHPDPLMYIVQLIRNIDTWETE